MNKTFRDSVKATADDIREQANQLRISTFLSFIYTADILSRYLDLYLSKYPIGRTGFGVLHHLVLNGGTLAPTNLSKRVFRSKYAITRIIDDLEKRGLVIREAINRDRRKREVSITREGLEFVRNSSAIQRQHLGDIIFQPLDQKRLEELKGSLRDIRKHVLGLFAGSQAK